MKLSIYDMLQEYDPKSGCEYCPYLASCVAIEGSGYTQQDEYGSCPDDYSAERLEEQLVDERIATTNYPPSEAYYVSLRDFEEQNGVKLVLSPTEASLPILEATRRVTP